MSDVPNCRNRGSRDFPKIGDVFLLQPDAFTMLNQIAECEVDNRPGRLEPRLVKRRAKPYELMQKPRNELREQLRKECT